MGFYAVFVWHIKCYKMLSRDIIFRCWVLHSTHRVYIIFSRIMPSPVLQNVQVCVLENRERIFAAFYKISSAFMCTELKYLQQRHSFC